MVNDSLSNGAFWQKKKNSPDYREKQRMKKTLGLPILFSTIWWRIIQFLLSVKEGTIGIVLWREGIMPS